VVEVRTNFGNCRSSGNSSGLRYVVQVCERETIPGIHWTARDVCGQLELQDRDPSCQFSILTIRSCSPPAAPLLLPSLSFPSSNIQRRELSLGQRWTLGRAAEIQQQEKQKESMSLSRSFIDIHSACERGDLEEVKRYLQAGGDIEKKKVLIQRHLSPLISSHLSQDGETPLIYACRYCHTEVALFLIEKGASINHQDNVRVACP
jgi:hypothetical protein